MSPVCRIFCVQISKSELRGKKIQIWHFIILICILMFLFTCFFCDIDSCSAGQFSGKGCKVYIGKRPGCLKSAHQYTALHSTALQYTSIHCNRLRSGDCPHLWRWSLTGGDCMLHAGSQLDTGRQGWIPDKMSCLQAGHHCLRNWICTRTVVQSGFHGCRGIIFCDDFS